MMVLLLLVFCFQLSEPEYAGVFYAVSEGQQFELERRDARLKTKSNIFTASAKGYAYIDGKKSPIRFASNDAVVVLVRVANRSRDPRSQIRLLKLESKGDSRRFTVSEASAGVFNPRVSVKEWGRLDFKAEKYGDSSFRITVQGLQPGEYAFDSIDSVGAFCFGIDKPKSTK